MSDAVVLKIRGLGHVPSFKNNKRIFGRNLVTKPEVAKWMEAAIRSFQSQLRSGFRTTEGEISTEDSAQCWTALSEHSTDFDDSLQWIPDVHLTVEQVGKGEEGADIHIKIT